MSHPRHLNAQLTIAYIAFVTNGETILTLNRLRVWAHRHPNIAAGRAPDNTALYNIDGILTYLQTRRVVAQPHKRPVI